MSSPRSEKISLCELLSKAPLHHTPCSENKYHVLTVLCRREVKTLLLLLFSLQLMANSHQQVNNSSDLRKKLNNDA